MTDLEFTLAIILMIYHVLGAVVLYAAFVQNSDFKRLSMVIAAIIWPLWILVAWAIDPVGPFRGES